MRDSLYWTFDPITVKLKVKDELQLFYTLFRHHS